MPVLNVDIHDSAAHRSWFHADVEVGQGPPSVDGILIRGGVLEAVFARWALAADATGKDWDTLASVGQGRLVQGRHHASE